MLGLFADGDYVIADYNLYPRIGKTHFWNGEYTGSDLLHMYYAYSGGSLIYDSPLCLFPTEHTSYLNYDRVIYYKNRLKEGNHYPRAIAYYLSGGIALLLDGHHKVTAACLEGEPARCLVIMNTNIMKNSEWMSLNQNRTYRVESNRLCSGINPMSLNDKNGDLLGQICTITEQNLSIEKQELQPDTKQNIEWTSIPEKLCKNIKNYPDIRLLTEGMMIPKNQIRHEFDKLIHHTDPQNDKGRLYYLLKYCKAFPESKWITKNERKWIEKMEKQVN